MADLYGFPHVSRIFYINGTPLDKVYQKLKVEEKYPRLSRWIKEIRDRKELNDGRAIIHVKAFHYWVEEL
jgi:glutathione S-transferase